MNKLIYITFLAVFSLDFVVLVLGVGGRAVAWTPEFLSVIVMVIVLLRIGQLKPFRPAYIALIVTFVLVTVAGLVINAVEAGPMLAGIRSYYKWLPFFFLPFVYRFSERDIRKQAILVFVVALAQVPVAAYQRLVQHRESWSGDLIGGTLGQNTSGTLTLFLVCVIAVLVAMYLRGDIKRGWFLASFAALFIPMTMNETKVTVVFLPLAFIIPAIFSPKKKIRTRSAIPLMLVGVISAVVFVQVYDHFRSARSSEGLVDFFTKEGGGVESYLFQGKHTREGGVQRFDSLVLAVKTLGIEGKSLLGVGIGNASPSFSEKLTGEYYKKYSHLAPALLSLTKILWETGFVGTIILLALMGLVFMDALKARNREGFIGALALGWSAVVVLIAASFGYQKTFDENVFMYPFWYFSGVIAAASVGRVNTGQRTGAPHSSSNNAPQV